MANSSSSAGMATISSAFSPTLTCQYHALARGEGQMHDGLRPFLLVGAPHRFAVDGDHFGRRLRQRRRPRDQTALERDRVEPVMMPSWSCVCRWRSVESAAGRAGPAEARNVGHRLRPRQRRRQHQKQHLVERIGDLPLLPVIRQGLEDA